MRKNNYTWFIVAITIAVTIVIVPLICYLYTFKNGISLRNEDWGTFGDFMNVFVSFASLIVVSALTYQLHKIELQNATESHKLDETRSRPILIFKDIGGKWACSNVGVGTGLNVLIAYKYDEESPWMHPVKAYSLKPGDELTLDWKKYQVYEWRARYYDVWGNVFTSTCKEDETKVEINYNGLESEEKSTIRLEDARRNPYD